MVEEIPPSIVGDEKVEKIIIDDVEEAIAKFIKITESYQSSLDTVLNGIEEIQNKLPLGVAKQISEELDEKFYAILENTIKDNVQEISRDIAKEIKKGVKKEMEKTLLKRYFKPGEVAAIFNVSKSCVYNWIKEGKLHSVHIGDTREYQISKEDVDRFEKKYIKKICTN